MFIQQLAFTAELVLVFWNHDFAEIQYEPAGSDRDTTLAVEPKRLPCPNWRSSNAIAADNEIHIQVCYVE